MQFTKNISAPCSPSTRHRELYSYRHRLQQKDNAGDFKLRAMDSDNKETNHYGNATHDEHNACTHICLCVGK